MLTAFDSSKDVSVNKSVLGGSRFSAAALNSCAQFLDIETEAPSGERIYTNKPSLANRIILEIQSLYPIMCAECDKEYSIIFDSDSKPPLRCFICFQGCHDCAAYEPPTDAKAPPKGTVWLCKSCHDNSNPIKPKKPKSKPSSKAPSKQATPAPTPGSNTPAPGQNQQQIQFSETELQNKLDEALRNQQQHDLSCIDKSKRPNLRLGEICNLFKVGKCPHGLSGKTPTNGQSSCKMYHPKRCTKFIRNGTHRKYGCKRGDKCMFFHPQHCPTSISDKSCYSNDCTLVHPVGTKRHKPPDRDSSRSYKRHESNDRNPRSKSKPEPENRNRGNASSHKPRSYSQGEGISGQLQQKKDDFLEIRSLLTNFQSSFQKEIEELKSSIANQESRLASVLPSISQHLIRQFLPQSHHDQSVMFHQAPPSVPQFQPQMHAPPPLPQMNWTNFPVSGC